MDTIYAITEKDVGGPGTEDATEYVRFQHVLQPKQRDILQSCLNRAKETAPEYSETADMIRDALNLFEAKTGIFGNITNSPIFDQLVF